MLTDGWQLLREGLERFEKRQERRASCRNAVTIFASCSSGSYVPADSARACPRLSSRGANSYSTELTLPVRIHLSESETSFPRGAVRLCINYAGHATILMQPTDIHNLHEIVMGDHVSPSSCSTGSDVLYLHEIDLGDETPSRLVIEL
jgi:hypothetical protein